MERNRGTVVGIRIPVLMSPSETRDTGFQGRVLFLAIWVRATLTVVTSVFLTLLSFILWAKLDAVFKSRRVKVK
jgi:hypothetical protein